MAEGEAVFTEPVLFMCTLRGEVRFGDGLAPTTPQALIARLEPRGEVVALNCNFGHKALPGHEDALKRPQPPPDPVAGRRRPRRPQGDGTCFNSAIEARVVPEGLGQYFALKSFPSTGQTQVPGVREPDFSDGRRAFEAWSRYLVGQGLGPARIENVGPILQNFKFRARFAPREVFNLRALYAKLREAKESADNAARRVRIHEIRGPIEVQNMTFLVSSPGVEKTARVKIFPGGKVNILSAHSLEMARDVRDFLAGLVVRYRGEVVAVPPEPDAAAPA